MILKWLILKDILVFFFYWLSFVVMLIFVFVLLISVLLIDGGLGKSDGFLGLCLLKVLVELFFEMGIWGFLVINWFCKILLYDIIVMVFFKFGSFRV